ncbi:anti-sigma factor domain-containing protein [Paludisphaera mucosa]|uniref:Anti-sigma factor n=1 Tax=Paludisphaera mucosa TaxID=3030827 RepID=A0ABT6FAJ6_9BACT|nr:anti-sigma factor [Paludisphaera mucosa]MDG3004612.1 anti-sigma factor [Paludisphaera mucosa]
MSDDLSPIDRDRLRELLAEDAAFGLAPDDRAEVERLKAELGDGDVEEFERIVAALYVGLAPADEAPLPDRLRQICARQGRDALTSGAPPLRPLPEPHAPRRVGSPPWIAWGLAAACLLLALAAWLRPTPRDAAADLIRDREEILSARDVMTVSLKGVGPGAASSGELVWSSQRQRGFMRLTGVAVNDPKLKQYQLWIFDRAQDERYPIDGGVFDVRAPGVAILPIRAPIQVVEPYLFAVTEEKPGGVVVSRRDPIILLGDPAKPGP